MALAGLALLLGSPAAAKPARSTQKATEQAKQEVLTALSVGNAGHAEEILDRVFRADPDPSLLYELGLVAQAQGRSVAALDLYRRYQELFGSAVSPEIAAAIEQFASGMTAPVTVVQVTAEAGMVLCVDDRLVGVLPLRTPLFLAGGKHRFRLERNSEQFETGSISIPDGREAELRLTLGTRGTAVAVLSLSPVALFVIRPKGLLSATEKQVKKALASAARQNHLAPLPESRLALLLAKRPADCLVESDCQFAVAERAEARSVLQVSVKDATAPAETPAPPFTTCIVELSYFDVNAGQVAARGETKATSCAEPQLTAALSEVLQQIMIDASRRTRSMVSVSSVPEGAQVRVDGLLRGQTPYLHASFVGRHDIVVEQEEFHPFRTQVDVTLGQVATVNASLRAMPPVDPEPPPAPLRVATSRWIEHQQPRPRWRLVLGGAAIGVGVLVAGFGISALTQNGLCARGPLDGGVCDANYSTTAVGGGLLSVGIAVSAAGAVLMALPGRRELIKETVLAAAE